MGRLVDADTVVHWQTYDDEHETFPEHEGTIAEFLDSMADEGCPEPVDAVPAAKGKWKRISPPDNDGNAIYRCSKCQHQDIHAIGCEVPYCWYCGTRMEGEQDAELDRRDSETSRKT